MIKIDLNAEIAEIHRTDASFKHTVTNEFKNSLSQPQSFYISSVVHDAEKALVKSKINVKNTYCRCLSVKTALPCNSSLQMLMFKTMLEFDHIMQEPFSSTACEQLMDNRSV